MAITGYTVNSSGKYACTMVHCSDRLINIKDDPDPYANLLSLRIKQITPGDLKRPSGVSFSRTAVWRVYTAVPRYHRWGHSRTGSKFTGGGGSSKGQLKSRIIITSDHQPSAISKIMQATSGFVFVITFLGENNPRT